jgi:two-component sensor histidine kinase
MAAHLSLQPEAASSLALAVIQSSNAPTVLLDDDFNVIAASASFFGAFQIDAATTPGQSLYRLGEGEWDVPQLRSLLKATVAGHAEIDAYEMDLERAARTSRRLVLNARKLDYGDADGVRLMLTVADVTDARAGEKLKDDMLREKAVLLKELHHRVANSLQIIAAVLLQSARRVTSEETRSHLYDAHNRVMSVASVQKQLAASRLGDVHLRVYFTELCHSLSASMIRNRDHLSLRVESDDSVTDADVSVSLGLIVTELVINALKHAFPGHRAGEIRVGYASQGTDWTLSVSDDGVGMPADPASARPGLGSSIIEALAKQLDARVRVTNNHPGTSVSIVHA